MRKPPEVLGHWHTHVEGFSTSSRDFYDLVRAGIARRKIPDIKITQVEWRESGVGSGQRLYLRVSREHFNFDICAAPFGTGFFFSWWLARIRRVFLDIGFLLGLLLVDGGFSKLLASGNQGGETPGCAWAIVTNVLVFGMPFGLGAIVRYGDRGLEPTIFSMPITGFLYQLVFRPETYFNEDTANAFQNSVHQAVLEAVDAVTSAQGVRGLSEEARKIAFAHWSKEG